MKISIEQREDCGFRISDRGFKKTRKQRIYCGSGFPILSLSKGSRDLVMSMTSTASRIYRLLREAS